MDANTLIQQCCEKQREFEAKSDSEKKEYFRNIYKKMKLMDTNLYIDEYFIAMDDNKKRSFRNTNTKHEYITFEGDQIKTNGVKAIEENANYQEQVDGNFRNDFHSIVFIPKNICTIIPSIIDIKKECERINRYNEVSIYKEHIGYDDFDYINYKLTEDFDDSFFEELKSLGTEPYVELEKIKNSKDNDDNYYKKKQYEKICKLYDNFDDFHAFLNYINTRFPHKNNQHGYKNDLELYINFLFNTYDSTDFNIYHYLITYDEVVRKYVYDSDNKIMYNFDALRCSLIDSKDEKSLNHLRNVSLNTNNKSNSNMKDILEDNSQSEFLGLVRVLTTNSILKNMHNFELNNKNSESFLVSTDVNTFYNKLVDFTYDNKILRLKDETISKEHLYDDLSSIFLQEHFSYHGLDSLITILDAYIFNIVLMSRKDKTNIFSVDDDRQHEVSNDLQKYIKDSLYG